MKFELLSKQVEWINSCTKIQLWNSTFYAFKEFERHKNILPKQSHAICTTFSHYDWIKLWIKMPILTFTHLQICKWNSIFSSIEFSTLKKSIQLLAFGTISIDLIQILFRISLSIFLANSLHVCAH